MIPADDPNIGILVTLVVKEVMIKMAMTTV